MKNKKTALVKSLLALLLSVAMLIGTTFAWFTDNVTSGGNIIKSGELDLEMYWTDDIDSGVWYDVEDDAHNTIFSHDKWEPGYTEVRHIKIVNNGNLAFNYNLTITPEGEVGKLAEVINVYFADHEVRLNQREDLSKLRAIGLLKGVLNGGATAEGTLLPEGQMSYNHPSKETIVTIAMSMITTAGNEYQEKDAGDFSITALATQATVESDSFDNNYDANATYPTLYSKDSANALVSSKDGLVPEGGVTLSGNNVKAFIPEGAKMESNSEKLSLTVTPLENTSSGITVVNSEILIPVDIHIDGLAKDNTTPVIIDLGEILPKYMNMGNYHLYHVENGVNQVMTLVDSRADLTAHNQFTYDTLTGEVSVAMASFSEVAMLADTAKGWEGGEDYSWYDADAKSFEIANADQLYAFAKIVGGMAKGYEQNSFKGKTVKLLSDINLNHGTVLVDANGKSLDGTTQKIFYPVGYYNSEGADHYDDKTEGAITSGFYTFEGTFDGNGNTISNVYQNTWEMKGDHNWYAPEEQHYRDGMGIFGKVYGGTVKNLTVDNFKSDGEIATTGVITSYADFGATFENIAITNCNPRVYNIGNGGIVGCVGWYTKGVTNKKVTFKNITVDNSNKISALWGSYDVPCGGIVGQYYPTSGQTSAGNPKNAGVDLVNCHVAAQMDVYNDVCGNYQYYAYRYAGMIIGSIRENTTTEDGKTIPNMTGISATGCTVNYGDWNDYYYCEFEKNSMASYSEDYQFSRVPHSELNFTDSNGNGVVDADERASVTGCKHTHTAEENHQAIYLPFHQLFTGYSWGVSSIGLEKYSGIVTDLDITEGDDNKSVKKFDPLCEGTEYVTGEWVYIGDLFKEITDNTTLVELKSKDVEVFVSPKDSSSTVSGSYTADDSDWKKSKLTFDGSGKALITITDYYFCTATTVEVNVNQGEKTDKFDHKFPNTQDYIYRVGNENDVEIGSLFSLRQGKSAGDLTVTIKEEDGSASGEFLHGSSWNTGKVNFNGTGLVSVTITDNNKAIVKTLYLEVVDATNVTKYSELKDQTSVFLNDITMSSNGTYRLTNKRVLYGNGFKFDVKSGAYSGVQYDYASYVIYLESSNLDNVRIEGAVYPEAGATKDSDYHRPIVMTSGDCVITNSYISNGASPIRNGGNLELINTTLKGGVYANLDLRNGHLILDNVTTINQVSANDKLDGKDIVGMGIVVYQEGGSENLKITIKNSLNQYNYISQTQANAIFTSGYPKQIKEIVFGSNFEDYRNGEWINFGIVSMNNYLTAEDIIDERTDKVGYFGTSQPVTILTEKRNCYVYSLKPTTTAEPECSDYKSIGQGIIAPNISFDFTNKNYQAKTENSNDYCYEDSGVVYISMDEGDTFNWDTSILSATKCGENLKYTVKLANSDYTDKSIQFNKEDKYPVVYSFTDSHNYDKNGNTFSKEYTLTLLVDVSVVKPDAKHAVFKFGANGNEYNAKSVLVGDKTYVMPDVTATESGKIGSTTVSGTTIYYPITEMYTSDGTTAHTGSWYACFPIFKDALQIEDYASQGTGDSVFYNQSTVKTVADIPSTLKAVNPTSAFLYSMNATNYPPPTDPTAVSGAVCYTCNRNGLTSSNTRDEMTIIAEYTYTDNAGSVYYYYIGYHCAAQTKGSISPCVTPDTLVTLADGSKKRIDEVTYSDKLLVWNFYEGKYDVAPAAIIFDHGADNNTVIKLSFNDGTVVKVVNMHQFFNADLNKLVTINADTVDGYVGNKFAKRAGNETEFVELESYSISNEYVEAWGIMTAVHYNIITEGMISADFDLKDVELFNYFEIGDDMKFDKAKMEADIEKYGLYTYDDFAEYLTYEQFVAFNVQYFKIPVGKGLYTFEGIIELINQYLK